MINLAYIILFSLLSFQKDPPGKLLAFKQPVSKARSKPEVSMDGDFQIKTTASSNYLIWLVSNHPSKTKIYSVKINKQLISFDTAHYTGPIKIKEGVKSPIGESSDRIVQDNIASYIRIYVKQNITSLENGSESISISFKEKGHCRKKIKKSIEILPARVTE